MSNAAAGDEVVLIYATFPSTPVAQNIGGLLVDRRLVACANIMAPMRSIYIWNGKRETNAEVPVIMKTRRALAGEAVTVLRQAHPYDTPAILVLPVEGGAMPFLDWVRAQTAAPA